MTWDGILTGKETAGAIARIKIAPASWTATDHGVERIFPVAVIGREKMMMLQESDDRKVPDR